MPVSGVSNTLAHNEVCQTFYTLPPFNDGIDLRYKLKDMQSKLSQKDSQVYSAWISKLLQRGAIERTSDTCVTLPAHVVGDRVTHDCRRLAPFVNKESKFPGLQLPTHIQSWALCQSHIAKIDLSKAYHSIPLDVSQRKYYGFLGPDGQRYRYTTMPMGAQGAPKHFHTVMGAILQRLPTAIATCVRYYQDDIFIAAQNLSELQLRHSLVRKHLVDHGFLINEDKSSTAPQILVLGLIHDRDSRRMYIPQYQIDKVQKAVDLLSTPKWKDAVQTINGHCGWISSFLTPAWIKELQRLRKAAREHRTLGATQREIWQQFPMFLKEAHKSIIDNPNCLKIYTDASGSGIGLKVVISDTTIFEDSIPWTIAAPSSYIELQGLLRALQRNLHKIKDTCHALDIRHIEVVSDSTVLVTVLNKSQQDDTESGLLAQRIKGLLAWCPDVKVNHIHGSLNPADSLSRPCQVQQNRHIGIKRHTVTRVPFKSGSYLDVVKKFQALRHPVGNIPTPVGNITTSPTHVGRNSTTTILTTTSPTICPSPATWVPSNVTSAATSPAIPRLQLSGIDKTSPTLRAPRGIEPVASRTRQKTRLKPPLG